MKPNHLSFTFCRERPPIHLRVASGPALLAGVLWSTGNITGIYAIEALGIAVGWPLVQSSLVIANVWAIWYYKEVSGRRPIFWFLGSSVLILAGMCLLALFGL